MSYCRLEEDILLSEIDKLTYKFKNDIAHFSLNYEELISCFHYYMEKIIHYHPLNLYDNSLSKLIKDYLGDEIPNKIINEFRIYEDNPEYIKEFHNIVNYYQECIDTGRSLSEKEFYEMYRLINIDKEYSEKYVKYLIGQIIDGNQSIDHRTYQELVERFVNNIICKNQLNVSFTIGPLKEVYGDEIASTVYKYGTYYITHNEKKVNPEAVLDNLKTIFHEIWHTVQDSEEYSEAGVVQLFKMDDFIRKILGEQYYDDNYEAISYEADANLHAVVMIHRLLKEISPQMYQVKKEQLENKAEEYNQLLYHRNRRYQGENYDINSLFDKAVTISNQTVETLLTSTESSKEMLKAINF